MNTQSKKVNTQSKKVNTQSKKSEHTVKESEHTKIFKTGQQTVKEDDAIELVNVYLDADAEN